MWNYILEWLYPTTCIFCGEICKEGICETCRSKVQYIQEPRCKKCGKPIHLKEEEFCYDCKKRVFFFEQGKSLWLHVPPVSTSIYQFKYKNKRVYGETYGRELAQRFSEIEKLWKIDLIIPIPLHKRKQRKRGFNQAELVAKKLGEVWEKPVETKIVVREKMTTPQKELGQKNRRKNLRKAFRIQTRKADKVIGKTVLLIDDIYTTGSTIDAVAECLKKAGCEKIYFLTISIGQGF